MTDLILFWHRRDLRLSDHVGLTAARQRSSQVVGVFCLDPQILDRDDIAPARVTYMVESLRLLQAQYAEAGGQLCVLQADPVEGLPRLAAALGVRQVYWHHDVEPYAVKRDRAVAAALQGMGVEVEAMWDQLMHAPGEILTGSGTPYTVYTPFWKNWIQHAKAAPLSPVAALEPLSPDEQDKAMAAGVIPLPTAEALGFSWEGKLVLSPGASAAYTALEQFCQVRGAIATYDKQRNMPFVSGTSLLSPALKFGTVGIRTVWAMTQQAMADSRSDETRTSIETWQKELAWREFYQHALYFFPELADGPYRATFKGFPWTNDLHQFQAWCAGKTGYPMVDAAMRQLKHIGWMHNRCRMIVASFLTKDLMIDWRWGEKYFMQTLIDGDLAANNGGWQWSTSSGMDAKPLRIFNPASQAKKFDPEADYMRQWLPELRSVSTLSLVSGNISEEECDRYQYPRPIVDHQQQQQRFKTLYRHQRSKK